MDRGAHGLRFLIGRRPRAGLVGAAALLCVLGATPAAPARAPRPRRCTPARAKPLAQDREAQVYSLRGQTSASLVGTITYACLRSSRRRTRIGETYNDNYVTSGAVDAVSLVGHMVGSAQHRTDISCKADCPPGYQPTVAAIQVNDLRRKTRRQVLITGRLLAHRLFLVASGAAAWIEGTAASARVKALDAAGAVRLLDEGMIDPSSVKLSGSTLSWTKDGSSHSVRLS